MGTQRMDAAMELANAKIRSIKQLLRRFRTRDRLHNTVIELEASVQDHATDQSQKGNNLTLDESRKRFSKITATLEKDASVLLSDHHAIVASLLALVIGTQVDFFRR